MSASARSQAFLGATVVDVVRRECHDDQTVVVTGDRITVIGPRATTAVPADARRLDVPGRWIVPGLIDMHCHLTGSPPAEMPLELFLANGVTTVRDPGGRMTDQRLLREAVRRGDRIGPRLEVSGELLDGDPPVWPGASFVVDTADRAAAAVAHLAAQGADFVKVYNHVTEEVLAAIVSSAGELGLPVTGHVPRCMSMLRAIELGMTGLEHVRITGSDFLPAEEARSIDMLPVARREPLLWSKIDLAAPWVDTLVDALVVHGVTLDPTLVVDEVTFVDRGGVEHPDNAYLPPATRARWEGRVVPEIMRVPAELVAVAREGNEKRRRFVGRCADAGVRIVAGTDGAGCGKLLPGFGVHHELALLRSAGLSAFDALRAATIDAARAMTVEEERGSVSVGKLADFGVWTSSPLETHLRPADLDLVLIGGTAYGLSELAAPGHAEPDPGTMPAC